MPRVLELKLDTDSLAIQLTVSHRYASYWRLLWNTHDYPNRRTINRAVSK